ncbi:hypothetical protein OKB31_000213 [Acinetobacter baumannii]|nr:hypothetical protein [Acinetobacter baumannii]
MTDLNKERELYESVIEKTQGIKMEHLVGISFNAEANQYEISGEKWACELTDACEELNTGWFIWQECVKAKAQAVPQWINVEVGVPVNFGTRVKIKRKSWDEEDNLIFVESEATYDKDSDFCELSNRTYEYETWFDHELKKYLEEDEITHWAPLDKSESGAEG